LPPRALVRPSSSRLPRRDPSDPLFHKSLVTLPCPILPEEEVDTPVEQRRYNHVSTFEEI
jgi:hypothetical protein